MGKKKDFFIKFVCKDCGKEPEPDKEKSNENWNVVSTTCIHCGGKIDIKMG